ncbi:MAG: restriction endonuclease subunit S [Cyanobacteria bacterium REEB446]|nr:restriction endonuclease subunit S [Cyanobacteria bacterium REEB446]
MKATTEKAFGAKLQSVFSNPCEKWQTKKLGGIISLEYGKPLLDSQRDSSGLYPVYGANGIKDRTNEFYWDKPSIIVGRKGSAGEINITESKFWPLDVTYFIKFDEELYDLRFLYYLLKTLNLPQLAKGVKPGINRNEVYSVEVCVPESITEQHRIVSILDKAFTEIDKAKKNTEESIKKNKELFEAKLRSVFANTKSDWQTKKLGDICEMAPGGTPLKSIKEYWLDGKVSWYSSGELNELYTSAPRKCITHKGLGNSNTKLFPKGSLLIGIYDTAALKMSILDRQAAFNQAIVGIKPNSQIEVKFIFHIINAIKTEILNQRRGVRQKNLSFEKIKNIRLPLPPLPEQHRIVAELDAISEETKKLEKLYRSKLTHLEELKKSILKQAFEGKL